MPIHRHPIALPPLLATEFLDHVLQHHCSPTTLIICSTRETFLQELQSCIRFQNAAHVAAGNSAPSLYHQHYLLHPTIHLIADSRSIALAFTPTVPHLRAYLATYFFPAARVSPSIAGSNIQMSSQKPKLAIWGLASLHRSTTEYSAQGLYRTLAVAVEAAYSAEQQLVLAESGQELGMPEDEGTGQGGRVPLEPWTEQVPLISGSIRFGQDGSVLGGRVTEVGDVVGRWCRFPKLDRL